MKKSIVAMTAAAALTFAAGAATAGSGGSQVGRPTWDATHAGTKLDVSSYSLVWGDEFDGSKITANSGAGPWYAPVHANMSLGILQAPPSGVYSVQYGVLHLKTILSGTTWQTSNIQSTNSRMQGFTLQNGYWEVRAKMPSGYGCWSGIWLLSSALDNNKPHAEFDLIEFYGQDDPTGVHTTSHVWAAVNPQPGDPTDHWWLSTYTREPDLAAKFHTYGVLLDANNIVVYFDGVEMKRIARTTWRLTRRSSVAYSPQRPTESPGRRRVDEQGGEAGRVDAGRRRLLAGAHHVREGRSAGFLTFPAFGRRRAT